LPLCPFAPFGQRRSERSFGPEPLSVETRLALLRPETPSRLPACVSGRCT